MNKLFTAIVHKEDNLYVAECPEVGTAPDNIQESIKTVRKILEEDDYISLPSKFDIHEYNIMERFCLSIEDDNVRDSMYRSIKGSGAFGRFKDNIDRYNITEDWYKYREEAFKEIAIEWFKENDIIYKRD